MNEKATVKKETWLDQFHNHKSIEGKRSIRFWQHFPWPTWRDGKFYWRNSTISLEGYFFNKECRKLAFTWFIDNGGDDVFGFNIALPFIFSVYFGLDIPVPRWLNWFINNPKKPYGKYAHYSSGISISSEYLRVEFMRPDNDSSLGRWYSISWGKSVEDILHGDYTTDKVVESSYTQEFTVPEMMGYPELKTCANITIERYTRTHKRFYMRDMVFYRTNVVIPEDYPHPVRQGKGESSWDQDPVEMGNISFAGKHTPQEAIVMFLEDVIKDRKKYG